MPDSKRPAKPNVKPNELAIACTINSIFTVISLVEFAADQWAAPQHSSEALVSSDAKSKLLFLSQFYQWRAEDPIISKMFMALLMPLPFLLIGMASGAFQSVLGLRRASRTRHVADVVQACTLMVVILPLVVKTLIPAQEALVKACSAAEYGASKSRAVEVKCVESATALWWLHGKMLALNLLMFGCDVAKFAGNLKEEPPAEKAKAA